jgi:hypothetical protein
MVIASHIMNITDRGRFERLSIDILRVVRPEYVNVIHGGINAQGETINSPLDAFHKLPNGDFVLFEVTTDDSDLKRKWLHHTTGDLYKAAIKAEEWRKNYPHAKFTVWLCTNQRIKDDRFNNLFTDAITKAAELDLSLEFLEQSAIVSYLENDPTGQWLAHKYFQVTQSRLSPEKLQELSVQNIHEYRREIFLDNEKLVERSAELEILRNIPIVEKPILLIGTSGSGKSTLACTLMNRWFTEGQPVLRIKPDIAAKAISTMQAITFQLQQYEPGLIVEPAALQIKKGVRMMVVIDDINRSSGPQQLLEHILTWPDDGRFIVILPVWNYVYGLLRSNTQRNTPRADTVQIGVYSKNEASAALGKGLQRCNFSLSIQQSERAIDELSYNPFLIEIYTTIDGLDDQNWLARTQDPIQSFINEKLQSISHNSHISVFQLTQALFTLSEVLLTYKSFQASLLKWPKGQDDPTLNYLALIGGEQQIFHLTADSQIIFRHDKIRDHLLVHKLTKMLEDIDGNTDVLSEPYYIQLIGRALGNLSLADYQRKLNWMLEHLPTAVFESLHYITDRPTNEFLATKIVEWLKKGSVREDTAIYESLVRTLGQIDNPAVLSIYKEFRITILLLVAGFRNGEVLDGARYLATLNQNDFEPHTGHTQRDQLIEHFKLKFYSSKKAELLVLLADQRFTNGRKAGLILLSGYLKDKSLFVPIYSLWVNAKEALLIPAIWAMLHCFDEAQESLLGELFDYWSTLPDDQRDNGMPDGLKSQTLHDVGHCRYGVPSDHLVEFLIKKSNTARSFMRAILLQLDHPKAMNYAASILGELGAELNRRKDEGFFPQSLTIYRASEKWSERHTGGSKMGVQSRLSLFEVWNKASKPEFERFHAFRLWAAGADEDDADQLRNAELSTDRISTEALKIRLVIKDKTALESVRQRITADDRESAFWLVFLSFIWGPDVMEYVDTLLTEHTHKIQENFTSTNSWILGQIDDLLAYVPDHDATRLLENHWHALKYEPSYIMLALMTGTPQSRALVSGIFPSISNPKEVFKYFGLRFSDGAIVDGVHFNRKPISTYVFESLIPYLPYFKARTISSIAGQAKKANLEQYIKTDLWPYLAQHDGINNKDMLYPSDAYLRKEFLGMVNTPQRRWQLEHWLDGLHGKGCNKDRLLKLITRILRQSPNNPAIINGVAESIQALGSRKDLILIEKYKEDNQYSQLYRNTQFKLWRRALV